MSEQETRAAIARYREEHEQQPTTDTADLAIAIAEFERALPGWWWSVCVCSLTRDASCGPDIAGPDSGLLLDKVFDEGFHCDDPNGSLASSLRNVMEQALSAKRALADLIDATGSVPGGTAREESA